MSSNPHLSRRGLLGMTAAVPLALTLGAGTAQAADSAYAMVYFTESTNLGDGTDYGLHLAVSPDGLNWTPLNQNDPLVTPTAGALGLRDPFLTRRQDGTFVVLATDLKGTDWSYNSQYIHVWDSADLRTFTGYRRLKLHDMTTHSWAPEAFWDAGRGQYAVIGVFYAWRSSSLASGAWTTLDQKTYTQPVNSKHCGITTITTAEYDNLLAKWGAPAWNRLKSYNYPARYVRHSDYAGRIDEYPVEPYKDSLWTLVPGLADSSGVSFRSVNHPDHYLRHYDYALQLDTDDGTSTFAADATFHRTAGLADASWASFRSYNNPTRYIRHSNYVLRIDPISTTTEKQDATFRVGY
ncbi:AbfB domain-containing protein [Streptomyces sp. AK08-02]|uniref:AbfB domain-containing protein n=1 Tax=Streptomyces sp. AK08-02 TaxID=3028654 RepID=UPI0029ABF7C9|nr:AbfB domain-containing protein [Streptomyces sp. AK08-02]MDX3746727.1 AbfB domain-containing protein [Streptomyces sp. AK08-02]